ncbi:MAG TPA: spermidine synthase [Burkholderiaceae bacterium]|nr:spermidine synthase [Burkholderiaceae bacterium]
MSRARRPGGDAADPAPARPRRRRRETGASRGPADPPIELSEQDGVRYLHFGTRWIQGAMRIRRPFDLELDYVRHMMAWLLFMEPPARVLQLGLGAAALTKWSWRHLPETGTTVVEASASVVVACRRWFALPEDDDRLEVVHADAGRHVADPRTRGRYGVVQVDLYDRDARGPVIDTAEFYRDCRRAIAEPGMLVVNLFGSDHASFETNRRRIESEFDRTLVLPPVEAGNLVVLAFAGPPLDVDATMLFERAAEVERRWRLPARGWAKALREQVVG